MMRRLIVLFGIVVLYAACGKDSPTAPTPTPTPTPTPAPTTYTLSGRVTVAAPSTVTGIGGAVLNIIDSANAGRSATADGSGNYSFTGLQGGGFSMGISALGYVAGSRGVTLTSNLTINVGLVPNPVAINETLTGTLSGGDPACASLIPKPCRKHSFALHNNGTFAATLTWNSGSDLDLELYRGTTRIADSRGVRSSEEVSASITGGSTYEVWVIYYGGSLITNYTLNVSRMN